MKGFFHTAHSNVYDIYCFKTKNFLKLIFFGEILIDIDFSHPPFLCAECKFRTVGLVKKLSQWKRQKAYNVYKAFSLFSKSWIQELYSNDVQLNSALLRNHRVSDRYL